jgi:NADH dehydrogenase
MSIDLALIPSSTFPRIVIIGGGFGGITLAKELRNASFQIVLIDRNNYHTFQPLLYQVATGGLEPDSIAFPLRKIFRKSKNIFFRMAEVEQIHPKEKYIDTSIGRINFDYLVIASGSTNNFFGMEGLETFAMPLKSVTEALNLRSWVLQNLEQSLNETKDRNSYLNFVVVGGGPTGVEVAGALAELRRHVIPHDYPEINIEDVHIYLIENSAKVLDAMSIQSSTKALKFLQDLGVQVLLNTKLINYDGDIAFLSDGEQIQTKILVWSAGVKGQTILGIDPAVIKRANRYAVDSFNRIEGQENIFAIGDIAQLIESNYPNGHPMVAPVAIQQATLLAKNIQLLQKNGKLIPFQYFDKGSMATVGRNKAVVDIRKLHFQGAFAWLTWMAVHLMTLVGFRNRLIVFINWMWNFMSYDRAIRLIVRPYQKKTKKV